MDHLALEVFDLPTAENPHPTGSKFAVLPDGAAITITDSSEIFGSGNVWSYSFQLNAEANAHIFGTASDLHGSRLHDQIDHRRARLWVEGVPLYLGYLKLDDEAEVDSDGNVDVSIESGQKTFDELIEGAKANQVPLMGDVPIGVALWRKRKVQHAVKMHVSPKFSDSSVTAVSRDVYSDSRYEDNVIPFAADGQDEESPTQDYPQMVFPKGSFWNPKTESTESIDCLNTDQPYAESSNGTPSHPYCNIALCYQRQGYERKNDKGELVPDYSQEPEAQRGYEYMPANRVNSAPNFYVLYWLRCLMKHLGIHIEENQMMDVEDLRRLFFVNTRCYHKEPKKVRGDSSQLEEWVKRYKFVDGQRLVPEQFVPVNGDRYEGPAKLIKPEECKFNKVTLLSIGTPSSSSSFSPGETPTVTGLNVNVWEAQPWTEQRKNNYENENSFLYEALATPECFPNVDVSEVISALENGFGMRMLFDDNYQRVRIVLLRNIFRSRDVQHIQCEIIGDDVKVENSIRGFRMTYGNSEDNHFYYKGFNDMLPHKKELWVDTSDKHDYSQWDLNARYGDVINKVSAFNKTCYVTPDTGDAHIIKVDKDAKRYEELHQSLYEAAGFIDAEDGDCTGEDETIHEISMGFSPAIMNDLNMDAERDGVEEQRFALFVDATMRPRRPDLNTGTDYNDADAYYNVDGGLYAKENGNGNYIYSKMMAGDSIVKPGEFSTVSDMFVTKSLLYAEVMAKVWGTISDGHGSQPGMGFISWPVTFSIEGCINEGYRLYLQDNYEPNDDGVSPIESHDWGLTLGIMRGSGSDAYVDYKGDPDDDEGNDTWDIVPGSSATAHHDTCDSYGRQWDYNVEPSRATEARYLRNAGWTVTGDDDDIVPLTVTKTKTWQGTTYTLLCTPIKIHTSGARPDAHPVLTSAELEAYVDDLWTGYGPNMGSYDSWRLVLSAETPDGHTAFADGRISLKLRAEKPNPYYDPNSDDPEKRKQYLGITGSGLQRRGLADQFYPEFSKWMREARIVRRPVRMELAQLLAIDKAKKAQVGDITGFIRKKQFTVSKETGLGDVTLEIMYI